jgi:type VI secretion system secreted protein Hcp
MATNMYLKFEGPIVVGESTDGEHKGQIEIMSYSHGESQPTSMATSSAGARTAGKVSMQEFSVTKYLDKSSPVLNLACCSGTHYATITIQLYRATQEASKPVKYMEYILSDAIIANYSVSGGGGDVPVENLSFNFATIKWSYIPQKKEAPGGADSAIASGWSLVKNAKI